MAKYGNSKGNNKGKKYIKLKGGEVATPEAQAAADDFLKWFGRMYGYIKENLIAEPKLDDDVYHDAALSIHEAIRLKNLVIKGRKRAYYLRVYHTTLLKELQNRKKYLTTTLSLSVLQAENNGEPEAYELRALKANDYDPAEYEGAVDTIRGEMLEFVRRHYEPAAASIFEIYMELQPSITYKSMAEMLGIPQNKVWATVRDIKAELRYWYAARRDFLLS